MKFMMSTISKIAVIAIITLSQTISSTAKPTSTTTNIDKEIMTLSFIETFKDIKQKVISDVEKGIVPSVSISVAKDGNVIWQEAFGWADKTEKRAVAPETIYSLASLTKPLTATGIMLLAEKDQL